MKALIRNQNETVTEDMSIAGIDWNTGMPLTCPDWAGGPYRLVDNYVYPEHEDPTPSDAETQNPDMPVPVGSTVVIDGVTYTRTS